MKHTLVPGFVDFHLWWQNVSLTSVSSVEKWPFTCQEQVGTGYDVLEHRLGGSCFAAEILLEWR